MKPHKFYSFAGLVLALGMALLACGIKKPPQPPGKLLPPAVRDLSFRIDARMDEVVLTWTDPSKNASQEDSTGRPVIRQFEVFRYRTEKAAPHCPHCPPDFQTIGLLAVPPRADEEQAASKFVFTDKLIRGFSYIYKVIALTSQNASSRDSNLITFTY